MEQVVTLTETCRQRKVGWAGGMVNHLRRASGEPCQNSVTFPRGSSALILSRAPTPEICIQAREVLGRQAETASRRHPKLGSAAYHQGDERCFVRDGAAGSKRIDQVRGE